MTIFQFPNLVNPAMLNEQELRVELERINNHALRLSGELNVQRYTTQQMAGLVSRIVAARTLKNQEEMNRVVDEIIEKYVCVTPSNKGRMH